MVETESPQHAYDTGLLHGILTTVLLREERKPYFTRDPQHLRGELIDALLVKSQRGFGFTIVGGDESNDEFLQVKNIVPDGPADVDGKLRTGDVLAFVDDQCVLGYTHQDVVAMFQQISAGSRVRLTVCRGYPLPFDPDDPNTEIVTTIAITTAPTTSPRQRVPSYRAAPHPHPQHLPPQHPHPAAEFITVPLRKGGSGFGFTLTDSARGQVVKKILDRGRCHRELREGDLLVEVGGADTRMASHACVVEMLKRCFTGDESQEPKKKSGLRNFFSKSDKKSSPNHTGSSGYISSTQRSIEDDGRPPSGRRSKTPTSDARNKTPSPGDRPPDDAPDARSKTPVAAATTTTTPTGPEKRPPMHVRSQSTDLPPGGVAAAAAAARGFAEERSRGGGQEYEEWTVFLQRQETGFGFRIIGGTEEGSQVAIGHVVPGGAADVDDRLKTGDEILLVDGHSVVSASHHTVVQLMGNAAIAGRVSLSVRRPKRGASRLMDPLQPFDVVITRSENQGFGFVIISSVNRSGSTIGSIIEGSPAEASGRLRVGDRIAAVNGVDITATRHGDVVRLVKDSSLKVTLSVLPPGDDASVTGSISQRVGQSAAAASQSPKVAATLSAAGGGVANGPISHSSPNIGRRDDQETRASRVPAAQPGGSGGAPSWENENHHAAAAAAAPYAFLGGACGVHGPYGQHGGYRGDAMMPPRPYPNGPLPHADAHAYADSYQRALPGYAPGYHAYANDEGRTPQRNY
ncbi:PREDICTED: membrane-associated guanylate kinase, WW and PDZ domain-containing protein 1-like [Priapulus caudatus]|uniref:Membrane-associated guanylate kinase, WW and PDZ domain-containing protein 1-like n=1 Tax=Priapulus caudatus TaxID=37621 RepID=A0ABM1F4E6_PRICU|nr:PREDICTED: membrane-associated guanylate kinase, WW and PDZ domain-containing protein 1-like [Priapulus caudatus]